MPSILCAGLGFGEVFRVQSAEIICLKQHIWPYEGKVLHQFGMGEKKWPQSLGYTTQSVQILLRVIAQHGESTRRQKDGAARSPEGRARTSLIQRRHNQSCTWKRQLLQMLLQSFTSQSLNPTENGKTCSLQNRYPTPH